MTLGPYITEDEINWHKYDSFVDYIELIPADYKKFLKNWKKLDSKHKTGKKGGFIWGFKKGDKVAQWKYSEDSFKLYHSTDRDSLWDIYHGNV